MGLEDLREVGVISTTCNSIDVLCVAHDLLISSGKVSLGMPDPSEVVKAEVPCSYRYLDNMSFPLLFLSSSNIL